MKSSVVVFIAFLGLGLFSCKDDTEDALISLEEYLQNKSIENYELTDSGLIYVVKESGEGPSLHVGDSLSISYKGYTTDDVVFSTANSTQPFEVVLGIKQVIPGWDEGLALFNEGGEGTLFIPSHLAYGEEDLIFDISIEKAIPGLFGYTFEDYVLDNEWTPHEETDSGIWYVITRAGSDKNPQSGQTVTVDYTGYFLNNIIFDTSVESSVKFSFSLGTTEIISGFSEAVSLLNEGDIGDFLIPGNLAYGENGIPGVIAPNQDLRFTIKLISIQ